MINNNLQCICRPTSLVIDQFKVFQCFKCGVFSHMSCYTYSPAEITKLFCLKCRLNFLEPFWDFLDFFQNPLLMIKSTKFHETYKFSLDKETLDKLEKRKISLGIICTKISSDLDNFCYEWPSENITITFNGSFLKYNMNAYLILNENLDDPQIYNYGSNTIELDHKEGLKDSAIFAVCLLNKKDFRFVAKEIAQMNQLSAEDAKKKFDSLKTDDVEVYNQFPIKDPITLNLIYLPARGVNCVHLACFDLMSFLQFNINGTKFRWKCPICKKFLPIYEIVIDSHLHKILKTLRKEYSETENGEDELDKIEYICFDEAGNWKAKQNFSEEWDKQNKKKLVKKEENSDSDSNSNSNNQVKMDLEENNNVHKKLTIEELIAAYELILHESENKEEKIIENFKEKKILEELSVQEFFDFLQKSLIFQIYQRVSIFEKFNENKDNEPLEIVTERLWKEMEIRMAILMMVLWAKKIEDVVKITFLLIHRVNYNDFKLAMEIFLVFSYLNTKKPCNCLEIRNYSIFAGFGCLLGKFFQMMNCEREIYGKTLFYFSRFMPDLHFPISISRTYYHEFYENLSDFILIFLSHLDFASFVQFFFEIHLPPQDEISSIDDKRLIVNFVYYFAMVLKKKNPLILDEEIVKIMYDWDKYNRMKTYFAKDKLNPTKISLDRFF